MTGLRLFAVTLLPREGGATTPPEATCVRLRDLGALVKQVPYVAAEPANGDVDLHRRVVEQAFVRGTVLPAPCGTVFRSAEQLRRWLDQNYIAISEGLHFVAGRCEGRVHMTVRANAAADEAPALLAAECFRLLRRRAAAALTVGRVDPGVLLTAAFLLERDGWTGFAEDVERLERRHEALVLNVTGPWPPYDFVRLDFGV